MLASSGTSPTSPGEFYNSGGLEVPLSVAAKRARRTRPRIWTQRCDGPAKLSQVLQRQQKAMKAVKDPQLTRPVEETCKTIDDICLSRGYSHKL